MFLVAVVVLGALTVPLLGGRLGALADLRPGWAWTLVAALALQLLAVYLPGLPDGARGGLLLASYPVAAVFVVANRHLPGIWLIGLGAACNFLAMAANGGVMPAAPSALAAAGLPAEPAGFASSTALEDPRLPWLGDVFSIPASWPLSNVFSVGDLCIAAGAVWALHRLCGSRLAAPARRRAG